MANGKVIGKAVQKGKIKKGGFISDVQAKRKKGYGVSEAVLYTNLERQEKRARLHKLNKLRTLRNARTK